MLGLERELLGGRYRLGRYRTIEIAAPKRRTVSAAPFRDRVVHHAFCAVVEPAFERGFVHDSYANRRGKGTHRAIARYEAFRNRFRNVLRCDIYRYFPAIDHAILKRDLLRRIRCPRVGALAGTIIGASNPQERVHAYFPGDDLFAAFERRRGLPIGNLTSQFFANVYLDGLDHFCKEVLRARGYLRYVDDFALFHDDAGGLEDWRECIAAYLEGRRLLLHPRKTAILSTAAPAAFLGLVLLPDGGRRLPEANVRRFRGRLQALRACWRRGAVSRDEVRARRACRHLAASPDALPGRMVRSVPEAWPPLARGARGGSWNNNPRNLRSANRNRNTTGNRNNNNGFRVARTLRSRRRRAHGRAGCADERPGAAMVIPGPAPLLP